jgi:L-iditol 2-dehydrogenase
MKAMVLKAPRELSLTQVKSPTPAAACALIRVTHTGVCGTDLKIYNGTISVQYPRVMGHEMVGNVEESSDLAVCKPGDRVIVDPMVYCGRCFHCRIGQTNLCPNGFVLGRDADGGFAEFIVVPLVNVFAPPKEVLSQDAPLIQVATTCLHAQRLVPYFPGESVLVMGLGVTGQLHVQLAKARGAAPVIGLTRSPFKGDMALRFGADAALVPGENLAEEVLGRTAGRGADVVIETTGRTEALAQAIEMARFGGRLLLFGINTSTNGRLPFYQLYFKQLTLFNARAAKGEDYETCMDLLRSGALQFSPLVTHRFPLTDLKRSIEMVDSSEEKRLKVILEH